ncbi:MAG: sigma-70 family RNA polymerase sigma factor [Planctomycetota bacterium]|nr:sigma-70 family RNA polymerase sigma factor [Planctomycetota bacterium]
MTTHNDRLSTIAAAIEGDEEAFTQLVAAYSTRLRWLIKLRINPALRARVSAEDVLQDAMVAASQYIQDLVIRDEAAFWSWLCRVVEHRLVDLHRMHVHSAKRDVRRERRPNTRADGQEESAFDWEDPDQSSPSERIRGVEQREALEAALAQLPQAQSDVIVLRILEGLSTTETAEIMGRTPGALSVLLHKSVKRLGQILKQNQVNMDFQ